MMDIFKSAQNSYSFVVVLVHRQSSLNPRCISISAVFEIKGGLPCQLKVICSNIYYRNTQVIVLMKKWMLQMYLNL